MGLTQSPSPSGETFVRLGKGTGGTRNFNGGGVVPPVGPQLVQQKTGGDSGVKNFLFSFDAPVQSNNLVVVCVSYLNTTILNSVGLNIDGLSSQIAANGTGIATEIWSVITTMAAQLDVALTTANGTDLVVNMSEWSGVSTAIAEAVNTGTGVLSATVATSSVTPVAASNLIIGAGGWTANDYLSGPTNGFTRMTQVGQGATTFQESGYIIQLAATTKSIGWSLTAGINWAAVIAEFAGT